MRKPGHDHKDPAVGISPHDWIVQVHRDEIRAAREDATKRRSRQVNRTKEVARV